MLNLLIQLLMFSAKSIILVVMILLLLAGIIALLSKGKDKLKGRISIKNLNEKYKETTQALLEEILPKEQFKTFLKKEKIQAKEKTKAAINEEATRTFLINFHGDIKASAVSSLREEITAILGIATPKDEVVVCLESGGGMVHAYGLAAAELLRLRQKNIPLTIIVDKIAASGGYLMASVANKILAAPFAIIGSIGVIVQLPNFHRLLKEHNIDFEQLTAGNYKRTLTVFGENTKEGRDKLLHEIEDVHQIFKNLIQEYRPQVDIQKVATGEHWLATQAVDFLLVDELKTSDDYLLEKSQTSDLFEISYQLKKSLGSKLSSAVSTLLQMSRFQI
jgi:serine protease SohB